MPSILVADDEIIFYLELQQQLCSWGHKVFLANSGEEAVQLAIQEKPDLILMDIMMPGGMNGIDAAKIIQSHIDCPIVLITGCEDSILVDLATQCLPAGYLYKPVSNSQLYAVVNLALSNKSVRTAHQHQLRLGSDELIKKEIQHGNDPENRQKNFQSLIPSFLIEDILTESVLHSEKNKKFHFQHTCLNEIILPMLQKLHDDGIHLSTAEMKVALLVRLGKSTKQIADILCVSADTIHSHRKHIRKKLGITSSASNLGAHLSNII